MALFKPSFCLGKSWKFFPMSLRSLASEMRPTLTMYTKEECSLCDEAKETLAPYFNKVHFEEVDITAPGNEEFFYKYRFDIPVFHLNGNYLMKHFVNKNCLEAALSKIKDS